MFVGQIFGWCVKGGPKDGKSNNVNLVFVLLQISQSLKLIEKRRGGKTI